MVSAARTWALFKLIRIFIFSLSTIVCMALTALYTVLLIRGWSSFMVDQRAVVLILLSIYGISSIVLYLMLVVHFRPWMDGARVAFLVLFQAGGTVTFFLFRPSFPCHNIGPELTCKTMEDIVIFGGWSLSGILLIYAFSLVIMSYIPVPAPPPNPEAALAVKLGNDLSLTKEKRDSTISVGSHYSQPSFIESTTPTAIDHNRRPARGPNYYRPGTPTSVHSIVPSIFYPTVVTRAPSITGPGRMRYNYYRPGTPGSVRSTTTSRSSTQGLTNSRYNYIYPSRVPTPASGIRPALSPNAQPPNEPISRQGSPLSVVSYQDPTVTDGLYDQLHPGSLTPLGLTPGVRGWNTSQQLTLSQPLTYGSNMAAPPIVQPFSATNALRSASPWIRPPGSERSGRMSSRSGSVSSVPRSPSPQNFSFNAPIPASPMSAVLPAHPGLPMNPYRVSHGVHEVRRYGSVADIRVNDAPTYANSHYRTASDYHEVFNNNFAVRGNIEQHANIQRWRRDLIYNATK